MCCFEVWMGAELTSPPRIVSLHFWARQGQHLEAHPTGAPHPSWGQHRTPNINPTSEMLRQWPGQPGQAPGEADPEPGVEVLWEQEMERLCASRVPVRALPYAMVDKRCIRWVPEGREPRAVGVGRRRKDAPVGWGGKIPPSRGAALPGW